jgi:hypothetical protein
MKFFLATLLAASFVYGADAPSSLGTWKLNAAKSKFSTHPDGPREATLTVTDHGWTFSEIAMSGKKIRFHR